MEQGVRHIQSTPSAYSYPLIIKQLLHTPILYAPDQEIVYKDKARFTYSEFFRRINKLASGLKSLGVKPGKTVAVLDWDSHRYLECFFAIPMMGAVLHTVNVRLAPEQILYTMNHAEDDIVLAHDDFMPMLEDIADRLSTVRSFVLMREGHEELKTGLPVVNEYERLLSDANDAYDFPDFDEQAQATTFYTTGTTGEPKGVSFSHRQIVLHTLSVAIASAGFSWPSKFHSGDVYMPLTPMFHVHAWGFPYVATLLGAKQVYPGRFDPERVLNLIKAEGVTFSHCVATILHILINHPLAERMDFRGWKLNTGGMAMPRGLARAALDKGIDLFHGYGMSETCPILTMANFKPYMTSWDKERQLDIRTKTGIPIPLVDLEITDDKGGVIPRDGVSQGEITVRTPWCTQAYFKNPEKSEELWQGGRLHTGDIATMDAEGYVQITDRLKDAIKTGGEWISSLEIESLLSRHEAVSESAVVGAPDEKWGERPVAFVVLDPNFEGRVSAEDLRSFMMGFVSQTAISKWAVPDRFYIVNEIPKTSVGKLNKKLIREWLAETSK